MPTKIYKDFDATFKKNPLTNDLRTKTNADAIAFAIKSLILTINGERPFNSDIGTPIKSLLFELYGDHTNIILKRMISDVIANYEPRAELLDIIINASPDNNALFVSIQYKIRNSIQPYVLNLVLERTR
jgi:phage baseplate assembly protein W